MQQLKSGIYQIKNLVNGNIYIGSAVHIQKRWIVHKSQLRKKKHDNPHLQAACNKYGIENFELQIMAKCPVEYLLKMEQWFLDSLNPEYNILKIAGSPLGTRHTTETKEKIRRAHAGRKKSKEQIEKISKTKLSKAKKYYNLILKEILLKNGTMYHK